MPNSPTKPAFVAALAMLLLGSMTVFADEALPPVDPAIAAMTADQKVEARQKAMKADGMLLRQARQATGDAAVEAATTVLQNFVNFPALFDGNANNTMSKASSKIWDDFGTFTGIFEAGQKDALAMLAAAKAGDQAGYAAAFKSLGGTCFKCHQSYRID